jgi:ligand-binding SRPBCC domain-containing protein
MKTFTFSTEQKILRPREEIFDFFSKAENLQKITPPLLDFHIVTSLPIELKEGALIEYDLKIHGWPVRWVTRIEQWAPPFHFVDTQIKGPYKLWHHTHEFIEVSKNETLMRDVVKYALPLNILGEIAHALFVKKDVHYIFQYRRDAIETIFSKTANELQSSIAQKDLY